MEEKASEGQTASQEERAAAGTFIARPESSSGQQRIRLVSPARGEVTTPLQQVAWPEPDQSGLKGAGPEEGWRRYLVENDRSLPKPVFFHWEALEGASSYDLEFYPDRHPADRMVLTGFTEPRAEVYNMRIGASYRWLVRAYQGKKILAESGLGQFMTNASPPRWINAPGITNVRDLGGWPLYGGRHIRQGLVYRGSEMNSHCSITDAGRKVLIEDLGIRTDVDLRGAGEDRMPVLDLGRVEYVNLPVAAYDLIASPEYSGRYRALFNLLSTRSMYPIFIHCWGGADRTGTVALLLGGLLGMRDEDLYTDYELTSLSIWGERLRHQEAFQDLLQTLALFAADGSSLQAQVEHYLRVIGVTEAEVARIREILVE